jgi:acetate kinase
MKILVLNCGSSTLKFQLLGAEESAGAPTMSTKLAQGVIDKMGDRATLEFSAERGMVLRKEMRIANHGEATRIVLEWIESSQLLKPEGLGAVAHRVVHGGERFIEPTLIDANVIEGLEAIGGLAPLHNGPALSAIRSTREALGSEIPMVAVFDTAFHRSLPDRASRYAIPQGLSEKHGIRRYGFHGIAHRYMTERYAAITAVPVESVKLITLQLGNGCSATAVDGGRSVDTSMGFTPLEGLMMGTRCGDADPSLAGLNTQSGLLGVSGKSRDMRELLDAERRGDQRAALAVEMFCYRVRKYIGAYLAVLSGVDAVVFGGGIGENSPDVRARICSGLSWCGIFLDADRNRETVGVEARITKDNAEVHAHVVPVNEATIIAQDTIRCLYYPLKQGK